MLCPLISTRRRLISTPARDVQREGPNSAPRPGGGKDQQTPNQDQPGGNRNPLNAVGVDLRSHQAKCLLLSHVALGSFSSVHTSLTFAKSSAPSADLALPSVDLHSSSGQATGGAQSCFLPGQSRSANWESRSTSWEPMLDLRSLQLPISIPVRALSSSFLASLPRNRNPAQLAKCWTYSTVDFGLVLLLQFC
jgi:hypothetical protein